LAKLLLIINGALIALNALMYWNTFRFARRSNRRIAALARQVRGDMEGIVSIRQSGVQG
jgi:hypothetical protein